MLNIDEKCSSKFENLLDKTESTEPPTSAEVPSHINGTTVHKQDTVLDSSMVSDIFIRNLEFRRWVVLISYVLLNFLNGCAWATFSPIVDEAAEYYSITTNQVCWFVYQFYVIYILFSIPVTNN